MQWEGEELFFTPRLTRIAPNDANVFSSPLLSFPSPSSSSLPSAAFCGTLTGGEIGRDDGSGFKRVTFLLVAKAARSFCLHVNCDKP